MYVSNYTYMYIIIHNHNIDMYNDIMHLAPFLGRARPHVAPSPQVM